jgi:hypothetical protein
MIERASRPMTPEERAPCNPALLLARQRRADLRSAVLWGVWGAPCLAGGVAAWGSVSRGSVSSWLLAVAVPLSVLGGVLLLVCFARIWSAMRAKEDPKKRVAFHRGSVETWTLTIDRAWWNLADEDCDGRLLHTTDGRYVFLGTYEWLDVPKGDDESRPMCPSRLRVVDDGVSFSLTALECQMIPLESVPDELPREVYDLPHFEVVVYERDALPEFLRELIEPSRS